MIFEMLIQMSQYIVSVLLYPFEALPDMPASMQTFYTDFLNFLTVGTFVVRMVLGEVFQIAIFTMVLAAYNAKWIYNFVMWAVRKLPIGAE